MLENDFVYSHKSFEGVTFENEWVKISDGSICVKSGYAWDGCTPKISIFGLFTLGTPDGVLRNGRAWTYYASLVHDVLCQFSLSLPFTKEQVIGIFRDQLEECSWPLTNIYVLAVNIFGPDDFK